MQLNVMRYLTYQKGKKGDVLQNNVAKFFFKENLSRQKVMVQKGLLIQNSFKPIVTSM